VASGVYAVLHRGFGLSFDTQDCDPRAVTCYCFAFQCPRPFDGAFYWITLIMVGVPSALMLALFYRGAVLQGLSNLPALLLTGVLGLGTLVLPYSLVFANHVPAGCCLIVGLYALLRAHKGSDRWLLLAGFATALAFTLELSTALFLVLLPGVALLRHGRRGWLFLLASLAPLAVMVALDWWVTGDPLPPQMHTAGYNYPGSPFPATVAGNRTAADLLEYSFRLLVGDHGLFAFSPVLFWAVYALVTTVAQVKHPSRLQAAVVGLASLAAMLYVLLFTDNFGGWAFGPRWFVSMTPALFFFTADPVLYRSTRRRLLFAALSAVSIYSAWQGASNPWGPALPLLRLETSSSALAWPQPLPSTQLADRSVHRLDVTFEGFKARLMGYALNADTVHPGEPVTVTLYWQALAPMSDKTALFVHLINSIEAFTAQRDISPGLRNLPTSHWKPGDVYADSYRLDIGETAFAPDDMRVQIGLYRPNGPRLAARGPEGQWPNGAISLGTLKLIPRPGDFPNPTQVNFGDQVALVGYDLDARVIRPGEAVSVTLYWQALAPMKQDNSVFLHLVDGSGQVRAMNDGMPYTQPKRTSRWLPGQIMQEVRTLKVPRDTPVGLYGIEMGVFSAEAGDRLPVVAPDGNSVSEQKMLVQVRVADQ
jgi:hypothetical protein